MKRLLILLALAPLFLTAECLFILYDAGETHALKPVMDSMTQPYRVLAMGTASQEVRILGIDTSLVTELKEIDRLQWAREQELDIEALQRITNRFQPDTVVTGMASAVQCQMAEVFANQGLPVYSYYDNLYTTKDENAFCPYLEKFSRASQAVLTPSQRIADSFSRNAKVVGQPSLHSWSQRLQQIDRIQVRADLGIPDTTSLLVFAGGYGGNYEEAFQILAEGVQLLGPEYQVFVQLHPKMNGEFERTQMPPQVMIAKDRPTPEVIAAADLVIAHRSTVGAQAQFAGKKVMYVDTPDSTFTPLVPAQRVSKAEDLPQAVRNALNAAPEDTESLYERCGIPSNAVERILHYVDK